MFFYYLEISLDISDQSKNRKKLEKMLHNAVVVRSAQPKVEQVCYLSLWQNQSKN